MLKIGRGSDCEIAVDDASVSRYHCGVELRGGVPQVVDLASDNGLVVNGSVVKEQLLCEYDIVGVGNSAFKVVAAETKPKRSVATLFFALTTHLASPTTDVERAVWSAMSRVEDASAGFDITNSLRIAAALSVPVERRSSEWGSYTNGMPTQAIQILIE